MKEAALQQVAVFEIAKYKKANEYRHLASELNFLHTTGLHRSDVKGSFQRLQFAFFSERRFGGRSSAQAVLPVQWSLLHLAIRAYACEGPLGI